MYVDDWTQFKRLKGKKKLTPHYISNCPNSITFTHLGISCLCYCKGNVHSNDKLSPIESFIISQVFFFYKKSLFIYCGQMKKEGRKCQLDVDFPLKLLQNKKKTR